MKVSEQTENPSMGSNTGNSENSVRLWDVLRSKNFLILLLFVLATSISIWLVSMPTPNIRNIMTETHKQINHLKENMNVMSSSKLTVDDTYLELLGFTDHPRLYPDSVEADMNVPVVVTGVTSKNYENAFDLIDSTRKYLHDRHILIFDLGLGSYELVKLKKHCNSSTSCMVKSFDFDKFPSHIRTMQMYKPLAIQEALNEYGAIIWTEAEYFITSNITHVLKMASKSGIAAWTIESEEPTSAHTHQKMFEYFQTHQKEFYFHRMVGAEHLVIFNTADIHTKFMLRWVECALTEECIRPTGSQNTGCNSQRRPRYRYSGCHRYEVSALNVILGLMFKLDTDQYTVKQKVFGFEIPEETTGANVTAKQLLKKPLEKSHEKSHEIGGT